MAQSLEQLKQENARAEAEALANEAPTEKEAVVDEYVEVEEEASAAEVEAQDSIDDEEESSDKEPAQEAEVELWMQGEEQTSPNDDKSFDSSDMAKLRRKLKAKAEEKDDEIAQLKRELEAIKTGATQAPVNNQPVTQQPKREDFYEADDPDEAYINALTDWKLEQRQQATSAQAQEAQQQAEQEKFNQLQKKKLDNHYEQVQDLISSNVITPDSYQAAETTVRRAFDVATGGNGDALTDTIIAQLANLGEGSAKVVFHLGKNATNRTKLVDAFVDDPSGLTMMGVLGELKAKLTSAPVKKISSAPSPSASLKGGEAGGDNSAKLARRYKEAHKRGDAQSAFNIKQEAKAAGIETRNWS